jgi:hypothetical protein
MRKRQGLKVFEVIPVRVVKPEHGPIPFVDDAVDGALSYWMPGLNCSRCGEVDDAFAHYPDIDARKLDKRTRSQLVKVLRFGKRKYLRAPEYRRLAADVGHQSGKMTNIIPGAGLGPFRGKVLRKFVNEFEWAGSAQLLIRASFYERMKRAKLGVVAAEIELTGFHKGDEPYLAVAVPPVRVLAEEFFVSNELLRCDECGTILPGGRELLGTELMLARSQLKNVSAFFTPWELPGRILASEKFVEQLLNLRATGLEFKEVARWACE